MMDYKQAWTTLKNQNDNLTLDQINALLVISKYISDLQTELQDCRASDLRSCDKYLGNTITEQMVHIVEEYNEVMAAYRDIVCEVEHAEDYFYEELIDLQTSCETMLVILGLDEQQRRDMRKKVIAKNEARGYYEVGE